MLHIDGATILRLSLKSVGMVTLWHRETGIRQKEVLLMYAETYRHM